VQTLLALPRLNRLDMAAVTVKPTVELDDFPLLFFSPTPTSQASGKAFPTRRSTRTIDVESATSMTKPF
jgi:hypothetical protein